MVNVGEWHIRINDESFTFHILWLFGYTLDAKHVQLHTDIKNIYVSVNWVHLTNL